MREGEPSRTAFGAAMLRALHQDQDGGRVFTDRSPGGSSGTARRCSRSPVRGSGRGCGGSSPSGTASRRTPSPPAVARGTRQLVVLGAGLDTFAHLNPFPETTVFEVDHPSTGAWKQERLAEAGIAVPPT